MDADPPVAAARRPWSKMGPRSDETPETAAYPASMAGIPTKRLLVYIVAGLIVLAVGSGAVIAMRAESARGGDAASAVKISAGGEAGGLGAGQTVLPGEGPAGGATQQSAASTTTEVPTIFVQVAGAVRSPGVYEMPPESRVFQTIERAGGFAADADTQAVTLAARVTDGCRVYVPRQGEVGEGSVAASGVQTDGAPAVGAASAGGGSVSINSAGVQELDSLPGIGPAIAQDIVNYREANGPFSSIDELAEVPGIGPSRLERLRPLVTL